MFRFGSIKMNLLLFTKNNEIYYPFVKVLPKYFDNILVVQSDIGIKIDGFSVVEHKNINSTSYQNFLKTLKSFSPNIIISFFYNKKIENKILDLCKYAVNFHGSLLPDYAGPHALNWQIINGEEKSGVTIHELTPEIDGGNIIFQEEFKILQEDTAQDVLEKNVELSLKMLKSLLQGLMQRNLPSKKQNTNGNEHICKLRKPEDSEVLKGMSVKNIYDMARALVDPWPGIFYFDENNKKIIINNKITLKKAKEIFKTINC